MDNIKILKNLGSGMFGTTYKVENIKTKKKYALKRQKILKSFITGGTKYYMWREIYFYSWINKLSKIDQNFFMKMYDYKFYSNCNYINEKHKYDNFINNKLIQKISKSKHCLDLILDLKDGTVNNLLDLNKLKQKQIYSMIIQVTYICYLLNKSGYSHNDLHYGNISYIKVPYDSLISLTIDNKQYKFKSYGYQFSAIDYGLILHKKFILTKKEKNTYQNNIDYNKDMKTFFIYCLTNINFCLKKKFKEKRKLMINFLYEKKPELYQRIKYLIITMYPKMNKYYIKYENKESLNKLLFYEIIQYLVIYDINIISKIMNKKIKLNIISNNHMEFFKLNINNHLNIIKYFIELL